MYILLRHTNSKELFDGHCRLIKFLSQERKAWIADNGI